MSADECRSIATLYDEAFYPLLPRYGAGDWNALHRDLYGDLGFPLQVVLTGERGP